MTVISQALGLPLGWIMWAIYKVVHNYGLALLVFTIITRICMFPLSIKQQKSSAKMAMVQPQLQDIQKKYKDNKEKLNEEMMKLYQKEGYNPMSGCLPLFIQFPILFGLVDVIYRPLTHILRLSTEIIDIGVGISGNAKAAGINMAQLEIIRGVKQNPLAYMDMGADVVANIQSLADNFNFLWMDLTLIPTMEMLTKIFTRFNPVIFIPILSGVTALFTSIISLKTTATPEGAGAGSMKGMMLMMPIFSMMIAFSVPAGIGLYWTYSNVVAAAQSLVMNRIYNPREMAAKAKAEYEARLEREREERKEAKKKLKEENNPELEKKAMTPKEQNRKKLSEARRRMAEKYGDVYEEDDE